MQAFACVSTAMVASTLLQHTALRGLLEIERLLRLDRVWYKNRSVPRELKFECAFRFECAMPEVCI